MRFHIQSNISLYYRLLFVGLFFVLGVASLGVVFLENYAAVTIVDTISDLDRNAIHSILIVMGILGICTAGIIVYLMQEKRNSVSDRRKVSQPTDFKDRRTNIDRRTT
jgi:hypothetical protein